MIKSLTVTNPKGESLKIELTKPELSGLIIRSIDGLGPPQASISSSEIATMDGAIYIGSRLEMRNIVITIMMGENPSVEVNRLKTYRYFPTKRPISLTIETDTKTATIQGYVESNEPEIFSEQEETKISILCLDPYFYDADKTIIDFSDVIPNFEFAFENPSLTENKIEMSQIRLDTRSLITYPGDGDTSLLIKIRVFTAVAKFVMYNVFTGGSMSFDASKLPSNLGTTFKANDVIEVSTKKGNKYVNVIRGGFTTNAVTCLGRNPEWFQLTPGDNIFSYAADDGDNDANVAVTFTYNVAYEGV